MNIAVIPARGGSKRIPRKNIRMFAGKPIISYAIQAARDSGLFKNIIVSTDDLEIVDVATREGAEAPFLRPQDLAGDHVPTVPVVAHAIRACVDIGWRPTHVCCIYPASPFVQPGDLIETYTLLENSSADYCFPVTEYSSPIQRALTLECDARTNPFFPEFESVRTQDLRRAYHDAGQFYWGRVDAWLKNAPIHSGGVGHVIPQWRVVDIDSEEDWMRAQILFQYISRRTKND